jgi:hypothetical protein
MPERMNRRDSTVLNQRFRGRRQSSDSTKLNQNSGVIFLFEHDLFGKPLPTFPDHAPAASIAGNAAASIPFRRKTEIGKPALGASHLGDLVHFVGGQREVEDVDIFRQPFDL